jgi:1,4-alpha-glucan branching enzyme
MKLPIRNLKQTFDNSKLSWNLEQSHSLTLLNYYRELIRIRKENIVFSDHNRKNLEARTSDNQILYIHKSPMKKRCWRYLTITSKTFLKLYIASRNGQLGKNPMILPTQPGQDQGQKCPYTFSNSVAEQILKLKVWRYIKELRVCYDD